MRSFVPPHRRTPQAADVRAPKSSALRDDQRDRFHEEKDLTIANLHPVPVADAPAHLATEARVVRPSTRIPLFSVESGGDELPTSQPTDSVRPGSGGVQAVVAVKQASVIPSGMVSVVQRKGGAGVSPNNTGMPDTLKAGVESLSGFDLSDVKVHLHSSKPAQLSALAYTQGTDIHVGTGQERHLPHEAWHVVQQMQGRVKTTQQIDGMPVNDDARLEHEADIMGLKALSRPHVLAESAEANASEHSLRASGGNSDVTQLRMLPGKILSPKGAKVYKSIGIINSDAIGGQRAAQGTRVRIDSERAVEQYEHVEIMDGKLVDGSPIPLPHGFIEGYINRDKLEFAGAKAEEKKLSDVVKPEVLEAVDAWLLGEARASNKEKLITEGGYMALSSFRKVEVFRRSGVVLNINDANSFKKLKRGTFKDSIDWVAFSAIVRRINGNASAQKVLGGADLKTGQTPFATSNTEYVGYVGLGGGAAAAGASAISAQTEHSSANLVANVGTFHQTGAAQAMQGADIAGGALATVANVTEIIRTLETIKSKTASDIAFSEAPYLLDQLAQIGVSAGRIVASVAGVEGHFSIAQVGYDHASAASAGHSALFLVGAQVTGVLSAVAGAAKMAKGIYDVSETTKILNNLLKLKESLTSPDFKLIVTQSQASQKLKRTVAGATIVQGAAMVAGGIMVAVLATNPIGWAILSAAAVFGGAIAAYKYFEKKANKTKFVDRLLIKKVVGIKRLSDDTLEEKVRKENLHKLGYTKVDAFYNDVIAGFAAVTHAALGGNPTDALTKEAIALVTAWRMNTDPNKTTVQMIASKMHSG